MCLFLSKLNLQLSFNIILIYSQVTDFINFWKGCIFLYAIMLSFL